MSGSVCWYAIVSATSEGHILANESCLTLLRRLLISCARRGEHLNQVIEFTKRSNVEAAKGNSYCV